MIEYKFKKIGVCFSGNHAGGHCGGYFSLLETETLQKQRPLLAKWMMIHMLAKSGGGEIICSRENWSKSKGKIIIQFFIPLLLLRYKQLTGA